MNLSKQLKADLALLFVTIGWGTSFLLTKTALLHLQTYNFLTFRFLLAFAFSSIVFWKYMIKIEKDTLKYGIILGIILFSSYAFQTVGLNYTTASKSAFITGFNVVLVPLISTILLKNKFEYMAYVSVIMAFVGLAFLTLNPNISNINFGDALTLCCAVITAFYIILAGKYTKKVESISFAIVQIGTVAVLSLIMTIATETPKMTYSVNAWASIITLSIICTSGAFIIQMIAQKFTSPTHAALIFAGEPVFAAIFSFIFLGEVLGVKGTIGAVLILAGMLLSELDVKAILKKATGKLDNSLEE